MISRMQFPANEYKTNKCQKHNNMIKHKWMNGNQYTNNVWSNHGSFLIINSRMNAKSYKHVSIM